MTDAPAGSEPRRILVLFAHPAIRQSEVNVRMAQAAEAVDGVTLVDLYAEYPTFEIDIDREQKRLLEHDVVIFLHPLYWYSTPAILKEWQDLVLEYGFAYGAGGDALHGKIFFSAISAGGGKDAYQKTGSNLFSIRELFQPLEQTANLCHMVYLPPFVLFKARSAQEEGRVDPHLAQWREILVQLRDYQLDITAARSLPRLKLSLLTTEED